MGKVTIEQAKDIAEKRQKLFFEYLKLASVSAQNRMIPETAQFVKGAIEEIGGVAKVLDDFGDHPIVYGFFEAGETGNKEKTLLFYNHYDVQPEDPVDEWETEPFEPTLKDGKLFCRGVSDNKANLMARLNTIVALKEQGDLPCNIKFLVEGQEEIGSPQIADYLEKYTDLFEADACIWESGKKDEGERFYIYAGMKGNAYFDIWVESADVDIHSSRGAIVNNAAWRLTHALNALRTKDHTIVIEDFYKDMIPPTELEKEFVAKLPFSGDKLKEIYGLKHAFIVEEKEMTEQEALTFYPTLTISGLHSGYTGPGSKTVLPRRAEAKIDVRLVPGMDPEGVYQAIRNHWDKHGFEEVQLKLLSNKKAFRTDLTHPFIDVVLDSAKEIYGEVILTPNAPSTGPVYAFGNILNVPIVSSGVAWAGSKQHAPNECIRMEDFYQGIEHLSLLLQEFGKDE